MRSGSRSVGSAAWSENKNNGMRKAQSSPGATGRIAARIKAARKNQTIGLRKEYISGAQSYTGEWVVVPKGDGQSLP